MEALTQALGERFEPGPILRQMVAENRLGRNTGCGFFEYQKTAKAWNLLQNLCSILIQNIGAAEESV